MIRKLHFAFCLVVCLGGGMKTAAAQNYPSRPINLIVTVQPGGVVDLVMRVVSQDIAARTGATIIVQNKPGADGAIGALSTLQAPSDGYTLLALGSFLVATPMLHKNPRFQTSDFVPVAMIGEGSNVLVTPTTLPVNTLKEFIEYARARPRMLNAGIGSRGGALNLGTMMLMESTGIQLMPVMYQGAPPMVPALVNAELSFGILPVSIARPLINVGKLKPLAVVSSARVPVLPGVPTMAEAGAPPESIMYGVHGLVAKAGIPTRVVEWWNREVNVSLKSPKIVEKLQEMAVIPHGSSVDEFAENLKKEQAQLATIVRRLKLQPE